MYTMELLNLLLCISRDLLSRVQFKTNQFYFWLWWCIEWESCLQRILRVYLEANETIRCLHEWENKWITRLKRRAIKWKSLKKHFCLWFWIQKTHFGQEMPGKTKKRILKRCQELLLEPNSRSYNGSPWIVNLFKRTWVNSNTNNESRRYIVPGFKKKC